MHLHHREHILILEVCSITVLPSTSLDVALSSPLQAEQTPNAAWVRGTGTFYWAGRDTVSLSSGENTAPIFAGAGESGCLNYALTICFLLVILCGANPNSAASQLSLGLLLVCLFNSRCSKRGEIPKVNLSLTRWVFAVSYSKRRGKRLSMGDLNVVSVLKYPSEVPIPLY